MTLIRIVQRSVVATAIAVPALAQDSAATSRPIGLGEAFVIKSSIMVENREIQVSLPDNYGRTAAGYPVLYVLDGSSHLLHATAAVRFLSAARDRIPEMIVVAIPNTNRNRDLTPGPGAAHFQRFLGEELIPWVESKYRTVPERILLGHSLGGSFAVHTLLNRPELFDAYIAVSAPVWRYDSLTRDTRTGLARAAAAKTSLYLLVGEPENENMRRGLKELAATLQASGAAAPAWSYTVLPDEDHSSTSHRSLYNALEARYTPFRFPFFEDSIEFAAAGGVQAMEEHYERFSQRFGYRAPVPESRVLAAGRILNGMGRHDDVERLALKYKGDYPGVSQQLINAVGYDQLRRGTIDKAVATFKQNAELFPDAPNVYDSLGDGYCRAGDVAAASQAREQAVRVAERRSHPRLTWYQGKLAKPCS